MMKKFDKPVYITRPVFPDIKAYNRRLKEIWKSQWLSNNGPKHIELETKLKKHLMVPHLSLFNNGTIALIVALKALNLKGEVITTPFTFPATPHSLTWNGLKPVFCDIDIETLTIDPSKIERLITSKTSAILGVHVFGTPCHVEKIQKIADKYKLKVIYDAAHAFGTEIGKTGIGNFGDITMFSFHPTKLFHTGEGGALSCKLKELKEEIDYLKNFGIKNEEEVVQVGINGKMNELQAAMGLTVIDELNEERQKRSEIEKVYCDELKSLSGIHFYNQQGHIKKSLQYFAIRVDSDKTGITRDKLHDELIKYNVFTRKYFYPLCSNYNHYSKYQTSHSLPVANKIVKESLVLPFYGGLKITDAKRICRLIGYICKKYNET